MPFIARWPGKIPAGRTSDAIVTGMDLHPTIAKLTGAPLLKNMIEGKDIWPLLSGLEGIASRHGYKVMDLPLSLFDLDADPGESTNVAAEHLDVVMRLTGLAEAMRSDLGDKLTGRKAAGAREPGRVK